VKIYKASIESLIVEATAARQECPVVYVQTLQRHKNGQAGESGAIALTIVEVVVSGWNEEGRAIEWRGCAGSCPAVFEDDVRNLFERAEGVRRAVRQLLERRCEVREGVVSEEPVYGELPGPALSIVGWE
jgi:hypothetical protein